MMVVGFDLRRITWTGVFGADGARASHEAGRQVSCVPDDELHRETELGGIAAARG